MNTRNDIASMIAGRPAATARHARQPCDLKFWRARKRAAKKPANRHGSFLAKTWATAGITPVACIRV